MNEIIKVKNLSIKFGDYYVLNNINFKIKSGEIVALIGPNGAGKTSLINAILGLIDYQGKIKIFGQNIKDVLYRVSFVPQKFNFDRSFPITVEEFFLFSFGKEIKDKIDIYLDELSMSKYKNKQIGKLSGGQLQRILIARALAKNPEILFLDEATTGIDMQAERSFYEIIKHLNNSHNITIVMISHEINMVYKYATKVICLNKDLYCEGKPKEAITKKLLNRLYNNMEFKTHKH